MSGPVLLYTYVYLSFDDLARTHRHVQAAPAIRAAPAVVAHAVRAAEVLQLPRAEVEGGVAQAGGLAVVERVGAS